jgi:hypothetical protein
MSQLKRAILFAALCVHAQAFGAPTVLKASRFAGFAANEGATETYFTGRQGEPLRTTESISITVRDGKDCANLLQKQSFPLQSMVRDRKLTPEQAAAYALLVKRLDKQAIHFFEVFSEVATGGPDAARITIDGVERILELHGTIWSISGQNGAKLPWMLEPARQALAQRLNRAKYKFIWELGRWAQDLPEFSSPAVAAALSTMVQEYIAYLGTESLDDAYVMIHSVTAVHTRYYDRTLGFKDYRLEGETNSDDTLYAVPLRVLLKIFPPSKHSGRLSRIKSVFGGQEVHEAILVLIGDWSQQLLWEEVEFTSPTLGATSGALVLRDHSGLIRHKLQARLPGIGIPSHLAEQVAAEAVRNLHTLNSHWNEGQYHDLPPSIMTGFERQLQTAIEISNLDAALSRSESSSEYFLQVLTQTLVYTLGRLIESGQPVTSETVGRWAQVLIASDIQFAITTYDAEIAARLDRLRPERSDTLGMPAGQPSNGADQIFGFLDALGIKLPDGIQQFREIAVARPIYMRSFSARQLFQLMLGSRPDLWELATSTQGFNPVNRYTRRSLRRPVTF